MMPVHIRRLNEYDLNGFKDVLRVFEVTFELSGFQMPDDDYLLEMLRKNDFSVFAAFSEDRVVGGLTAYTFQQYTRPAPLIYIYDLAVSPVLQRQGIGRQLMDAVRFFGTEIGADEVFVQADEEDDHALKFYRATGGKEEDVRHYTYALKQE